jgi:uncharacterized membrane protein
VAFILMTMPYFWLICFILFVFLAYYYLKRTRNGYKFEFVKVVVWNLALSFLFGSILYSAGAGRQAENEFAERSTFYNKLRNEQEKVWLRPERGVIVGRVTYIAANGEVLKLDDPREVTWIVDTSNAKYFHGFIVQEGLLIKVFGERGEGNFFIAEEIRPLIKERGPLMMP